MDNYPIIRLIDGEYYSYVTPLDSGAGTDCKSIILFDLAMLKLAELPAVGHDSMLFKDIGINLQQYIFEFYFEFAKKANFHRV